MPRRAVGTDAPGLATSTTTGPVSAQTLSMSQLLRWKWKSVKPIATGIRICRVRHCWLADVNFAPAFVRNNHAVSWTAGDDTVGSTVPGLILAVMAVQLIVGRGEPVFPHFVMTRRLPTKQILRQWRARHSCPEIS